ncbi:MAG: NAD-dependent epimerase/dehydratase family protein [Elusimicrobia bacterium]|nr:NAD-dependent epimerase/dehydratase family protein [Elusimicrobiota bacterium]
MRRRVLITGGAGFIGVNAAHSFLRAGWRVSVLDDLSRRGTDRNLAWLRRQGPVDVTRADLRDARAAERWVRARRDGLELVLHLAAQVAVTTSVTDPREDFERNAAASFNLLEAVRLSGRRPLTVYSSTNKVYGGMERVKVRLRAGRWAYVGLPHGVCEAENLDFHSPYGCSKGAADQYFRDYHRIYGLPTVVFRQSCIYGPHQQGNEDQGWLAHFMKQALAGKGVTVYGDGRQVRDALYVDDLVAAYLAAYRLRARAAGRIYNVGGGPRSTLSLRELLAWISARRGRRLAAAWGPWRPGDQKVYVSDIRLIRRELGWRPLVTLSDGLERLWSWLERG